MRLTLPGMGTCGNCGNTVQLHRVCPKCGYYRGKQVIKPEDLA
jgi:large subunit ribosomal protein L32